MLLGSTSVNAVHRMLMKLSPGVNFISVLWAAFVHSDLWSAKKTDNLAAFLHFWDLSGERIKAYQRRLMKLTPGCREESLGVAAKYWIIEIFHQCFIAYGTSWVNFISILKAAFALIFLCQKLQSQNVTGEKLCKICA